MRGAVEAAQQSAAEALDNLALEARLAPVRKGARVLREIAWRLREIGNDGRICDLIDLQVAVIEAGAEQITSYEAKAALGAAFAALEGRLSKFGGDSHPPVPPRPEAAAPSPAFQGMPPAEIAETVSRRPSCNRPAKPSPVHGRARGGRLAQAAKPCTGGSESSPLRPSGLRNRRAGSRKRNTRKSRTRKSKRQKPSRRSPGRRRQ